MNYSSVKLFFSDIQSSFSDNILHKLQAYMLHANSKKTLTGSGVQETKIGMIFRLPVI
jgi:hypothetical protein